MNILSKILTAAVGLSALCSCSMFLEKPDTTGTVDLDAVFRACAETGTYLEISSRHRQLTVDEIKMAAAYDVKFIMGSDAHISEKVGTCGPAVSRMLEAGLDPGRVVNLIEY